MRYVHGRGIIKQKDWKILVVPVLLLSAAAYLAVTYYAPALLYAIEPADATAKKLVAARPGNRENRLYIPKINSDIPISVSQRDESEALQVGAVNRKPDNGTPSTGGNFILAANQFSLGITPLQTKSQSPLYHITKLQKDDDIYIDFSGVRFAYKVQELRLVFGNDVSDLESRTADKRLTLLVAESSGKAGKRQAVIAKQVGRIVWSNNQPRLQASN